MAFSKAMQCAKSNQTEATTARFCANLCVEKEISNFMVITNMCVENVKRSKVPFN